MSEVSYILVQSGWIVSLLELLVDPAENQYKTGLKFRPLEYQGP